jgi:DNA-binding NarL/FixJ family response regulator
MSRTESKQRQVPVLLVEDEALIRMMIAGMVKELGHSVAGEAANITDALRLARTADFEIAIPRYQSRRLENRSGGSRYL